MGIENLYNNEAKQKIKDMAEDIDFCLMATNLNATKFHAIPMSTKKVDKNGEIWFLSSKDSEHNKHILKEQKTQLMYSDASNMEFLVIFGSATILDDKTKLKELYGKSDDMWFNGVDDPKLSAIKVIPEDAHYWEPKNNKLVSLFKMGIGAITGDEPDLGAHGSLKV